MMQSWITPTGRRPDGRPETFWIRFALASNIDFRIEMSLAMRFHNLLWRSLALCQKHWKTIRPGEYLYIHVEENKMTRHLKVETRVLEPITKEPSQYADDSWDMIDNAIDSLTDWKNEIADEVIRDRLESSCCPLCGDSEGHAADCDLANVHQKIRVAEKMAREVMNQHKLLMIDPGAVPWTPLLRYITAATAYAREFLEIGGKTDG